MSVDVTTALLQATSTLSTTDAPPTLVPGMTYVCQEHTDLNDTVGKVSFVNNMESDVACWHIACDKDVFVTFSTLALDTAILYLYSSSNGVDYTLRKRFTSSEPLPDDLALSGSVYVQFQALSPATMSTVDLDYVCMNPTPQPTTDAPPTLVPGMAYPCKEYIELNDTAGNVTWAQGLKEYSIRCWHIECDKSVVVTVTSATFISNFGTLMMYNSTNGVDYTLATKVYAPTSLIVLTGSAILQLESDGLQQSEFALTYVCMEPPPLPTTDAPPTLVPGMSYVCQEHTDLNDTAGKLTYASAPTLSTACWYIVCDKEVVVTILSLALDNVASFRLYSSTNGVDYYVRVSFTYQQNGMHPPPIVLNGSVYVQLIEESSNAKVSSFELDYACVGATPQPPTEAPPTLVPGIGLMCQERTDLNNTAGNVTYANNTGAVECWHIACDKDVVITFASLQLDYPVTLDVYSSSNGVDYTLMRDFGTFDPLPESSLLLNGSVYLQLTGSSSVTGEFDLDYVCMDATPAPATDAPPPKPTRAPGVKYICQDHTDLNNTAGKVTFANHTGRVECWHIACDKDVVITFASLKLDFPVNLDVYSSSNGVDYTLRRDFGALTPLPESSFLLYGSVYLQLTGSPSFVGEFDLDYVCMDTTPAPATDAPPTRAPGVQYICQDHTDLNNTAGKVTYANNTGAVECWHIACNKDVVITFASLQLDYPVTLDVYSSSNGVDYTLMRVIDASHPISSLLLNGSVYLQLRGTATAAFDLDYVCMDATPAPATDAPPTLVPGVQYICEDHTDLNETAGSVTYQTNNRSVECWHIECNDVVVITFSHIKLYLPSTLDLYRSSNGVGYTLEDRYTYYDGPGSEPVVLNGSVYVQLYPEASCEFSFEYVCVSATPAPATDAPPTLAPGLNHICELHTDLNDTAGNVTVVVGLTNKAECWHIECDKEVVLTFSSYFELQTLASLDLYSTINDTEYTLQRHWTHYGPAGPQEVVLWGSVYVQLLMGEGSHFSFDYVCVDATLAPTRAPGVDRVCQEYTALNDTAGHVDYVQNTDPAVCWHIACDKEVVVTFTNVSFLGNSMVSLDLYSSSDGVDYTLEKRMELNAPVPEQGVSLNGSAFLQFIYGKYSYLSFDYVCVDATPAPATGAPPTLVPGVQYICEDDTDLNNTAGKVTYANNASVECWHIECDKDVVITFGSFRLQYSDLDLYNTSDGVDYSLYTTLHYFDGLPEDPIVLHGSALLQLSNPYGRISSFELDYACMSVTPQPTTEAPPTLAPGASYMCQEHTDLNETAGHVDFVNNMSIVTCWYIECDKSVMITFTTLSFENLAFLELFSSESGNGTHYTLERIISHPDNTGVGFVLNGSALVQFVQKNDVFSENDDSKVGFNYVCMGATPQPDTDAPPTLAPGVEYLCHDHTDLNDTSGKVSYASDEANTTACWHIECDKSVAITFSDMQVFAQSFLYLYSSGSTSGSATHYTLEKVLFSSTAAGDQLMLDGSALVQFRSGTHVGRSAFDFEYVCQSADGSGRPTWPYVVFPVVGVLSVALGVVALLKSGVFKAKLSKYSLQDGVNNDERASLL